VIDGFFHISTPKNRLIELEKELEKFLDIRRELIKILFESREKGSNRICWGNVTIIFL